VTTTVADHSMFKGPEPMVEKCKDEKAEAEAIVAWVQMLMNDQGMATHEACITPYKPAIRSALTSADIGTKELKPREEDPGSEEAGVRLGTMKRIKRTGVSCSSDGMCQHIRPDEQSRWSRDSRTV
jgi:hypothetical protein